MELMGAEGDFAALAVAVPARLRPLFAGDDHDLRRGHYLRICGYIRGSMWLNILMSALAAALELFFLGVLDAGIWGAALGTCLSMIVCVCAALTPFVRGKALLRFTKPRFSRP